MIMAKTAAGMLLLIMLILVGITWGGDQAEALSKPDASQGVNQTEVMASEGDMLRANASRIDLSEGGPDNKEMMLSGSGKGELQLVISISTSMPVASGKYACDISGLNMPPLSLPGQVNSSLAGYELAMPGIRILSKPNNITVTAGPVKNMNVALMKLDSGAKRTWASRQFQSDRLGVSRAQTNLASPTGVYNVRIFGDAIENATGVDLKIFAEKRLIIDGPFNLKINTTGFPSGRYSIRARALNGSFELDEIGFADGNRYDSYDGYDSYEAADKNAKDI